MLQGRNGLKGLGTFQSFHDTNFGFAVPPKGMSPYSDQVAFGDMMGIIKNHVPNANTDNIAVSGFSLGAKMANRIAATRADVGVVASIHGTMDHLDQQLMDAAVNKHPIDGIFVLGTKDKVLPLNGGKSLFTLGLENNQLSRPLSQAEYWGRSNGNPLPVVSDNPVVSTRQWSSPTHENTVTEYVVKGGAHAIDGAPPRRNLIQALMGVPKPAAVFDAREKTWDFMIRSIIARDLASKPGELAAAG
jgi:poly(3-hydroxybutyrate) depolymerase